jgi:hypothetical protein
MHDRKLSKGARVRMSAKCLRDAAQALDDQNKNKIVQFACGSNTPTQICLQIFVWRLRLFWYEDDELVNRTLKVDSSTQGFALIV